MYNLDEQTALDVGCVNITISWKDWRGSLWFMESGGGGELLSRRTKAEENRPPPPTSCFLPSLPSSVPIVSTTPSSTHQHKRLPSDTPRRSSFLQLSSKTHTLDAHTPTVFEAELLCSQSKAETGAKRHREEQTDGQTDAPPSR